jgi:hypothetical protein
MLSYILKKEATLYDVQTINNPAKLYDHFVYKHVCDAWTEGFSHRRQNTNN